MIFTDDPSQGGVAQYNHSLLLALIRSGYRVACAQAQSDNPLISAQRAAGVRHHWLPYTTEGSNFARSLTDMATPKAIFEATQPALIIFSDCCPVSNLAARHTAMALRVPFIVVVGFVAEYLVEDSKSYLGVIAQQYARAREVIAVSEENLHLLRSRFDLAPNRGLVIHYGRPPEFFIPPNPATRARLRAELRIPSEAIVALTTARLTKIKGYLHQIAAIEQLEREGSIANSHFVWLGEGEQRAILEREIKRRRWESLITLAGHQWNTAEWYDIADLFILPSDFEGMPLSIMEAMAKGLPVIASSVSGIPEELGQTGRLLPDPKTHRREAVSEMAQTIKLWSEDADLRRQAGIACRERAGSLFREELMTENTLEIIGRVLLPSENRPAR